MSMLLTPPARGCVTFPTALTRAFDRGRRATTVGSAATSSMLSTSPTRRPQSGLRGIAISPSGGYHRCVSSLEMYGATECTGSMSPISAL